MAILLSSSSAENAECAKGRNTFLPALLSVVDRESVKTRLAHKNRQVGFGSDNRMFLTFPSADHASSHNRGRSCLHRGRNGLCHWHPVKNR